MRVVTIIDSDRSKIIDTGFHCGGIVPFPFRDGERNDSLRRSTEASPAVRRTADPSSSLQRFQRFA